VALKRRYELVKELEKNPRSNGRSLAENFEMQVYSMLKEKASAI